MLGVPLPRALGKSSLDAKSIAKTVGEASQTFAKTSKSVSKDLERASDQAERIGKILADGRVEAPQRSRGAMVAAGAAAGRASPAVSRSAPAGARSTAACSTAGRALLGVPLGPKPGVLRTVELLRDGAKHLDRATSRVSGTADDVAEIRAQLDQVNRRSPLEVVLDGLTHRRGAHRREG